MQLTKRIPIHLYNSFVCLLTHNYLLCELPHTSKLSKTCISHLSASCWHHAWPVFVLLDIHVFKVLRCLHVCFQLLAVVSELEHQGLTILVLGRKHMLRPSRSWERHNMDLIRQKAHCFFTENMWVPDDKTTKKNIIWNILHRKHIQHSSYFVIRIYFIIFVISSASFYQQPYTSFSCVSVSSEDDPFLLYATLHSGNHCKFVSRDLMRDHKACLSDGATRRLFFKWQRGHQLVVGGSVAAGRRVRFLVRKIKELVEVWRERAEERSMWINCLFLCCV